MPCPQTILSGIIQTRYTHKAEVHRSVTLLLTGHHPKWFAVICTDLHVQMSLFFTEVVSYTIRIVIKTNFSKAL